MLSGGADIWVWKVGLYCVFQFPLPGTKEEVTRLEIALYDLLIPIHNTGLLILFRVGFWFGDFHALYDLGYDYFPVYKFNVSFQALILNKVCMLMLMVNWLTTVRGHTHTEIHWKDCIIARIKAPWCKGLNPKQSIKITFKLHLSQINISLNLVHQWFCVFKSNCFTNCMFS